VDDLRIKSQDTTIVANDHLGGVQWVSTDASFTTEQPRKLGAVTVKATETYSADTSGAAQVELYASVTGATATSQRLSLIAHGTGVTIGQGSAGVDYTIQVDGESDDFTATYQEDENNFDLGDTSLSTAATAFFNRLRLKEVESVDDTSPDMTAVGLLVCDPTTAITITGFDGSTSGGEMVTVTNIDAVNDITIKSTGNVQCRGGGDIVLSQYEAAVFIYVSTDATSEWVQIGGDT